ADLELGGRHDRDALEIAERPGGRELVVVQDDHDRSGQTRGLEEASGGLRRRLLEHGRVDERQAPGLRVTGQSRPEGGLRGLAVDLLAERARDLGEGVAAALELRRADRALARAAGALLTPRLDAAAGDEPAALRGGRPG